MRLFAALLCCLAIGWLCAGVEAQGIVRPRACVSTPYVAPVYHQPYYAPSYHAYYPTVVKEYVPYAIPVEVYPRDHYYSLDSYYRDKLLVDAIVGRLVSANQPAPPKEKPAPVPNQPATQPPAQDPAVSLAAMLCRPVKTAVPAGLQEIVASKCIKCHGGNPKRADLSDLSTVPEGVRWLAKNEVDVGKMPKGLEPLTDEQVKLFSQWGEMARQANLTAAK